MEMRLMTKTSIHHQSRLPFMFSFPLTFRPHSANQKQTPGTAQNPKFRSKRAVPTGQQTLELAVVVDQGLWDLYGRRYGAEAEAALRAFVDATIDTATLLWQIDSVQPQLAFKIALLEVCCDRSL